MLVQKREFEQTSMEQHQMVGDSSYTGISQARFYKPAHGVVDEPDRQRKYKTPNSPTWAAVAVPRDSNAILKRTDV